jgi:hypothetical protein
MTTISEVRKKIERERIIINGARSMFSQTDNPAVQNRLRSSIHESERNINYLSERLKELELKARSAQPQALSNQASQLATIGAQRASIGSVPPAPPPKDARGGALPQENGRGFNDYGQRGWQQQPGPGIPAKSRQYTKLGASGFYEGTLTDDRFDQV